MKLYNEDIDPKSVTSMDGFGSNELSALTRIIRNNVTSVHIANKLLHIMAYNSNKKRLVNRKRLAPRQIQTSQKKTRESDSTYRRWDTMQFVLEEFGDMLSLKDNVNARSTSKRMQNTRWSSKGIHVAIEDAMQLDHMIEAMRSVPIHLTLEMNNSDDIDNEGSDIVVSTLQSLGQRLNDLQRLKSLNL